MIRKYVGYLLLLIRIFNKLAGARGPERNDLSGRGYCVRYGKDTRER